MQNCYSYIYKLFSLKYFFFWFTVFWQPHLSFETCTEVWPSETSGATGTLHLRSTADHDAANSVGESVWEHAGNVIIHDLHLAALVLTNLIQADLVLLRVLKEKKWSVHLECIQITGLKVWEHCVCIYTPFWQVWRKAGNRSSDSCSKNPNEDTRPSPGCTSHRRSSSAQSPQNCRGRTKRWVRYVILSKTCVLHRCRFYGDAYGPHSTRSERTLSMPISQTFMHSALISIMRPWKFSWSNTYI